MCTKYYFILLAGVALGIAGDSANNVLWRLVHGEMPDGFNPKIWWVSVGMNDLTRQQCSEEVVVLGVLRIVEEIIKRRPKARIVINSLLPMADLRGGMVVKEKDYQDAFSTYGGKRVRHSATRYVRKFVDGKERIVPVDENGKEKDDNNRRLLETALENYSFYSNDNSDEINRLHDELENTLNLAPQLPLHRNLKEENGEPEAVKLGRRIAKDDYNPTIEADKHEQKKYSFFRKRRMPLWTSIFAINKQLFKFCEKHEQVDFFDATNIFAERKTADGGSQKFFTLLSDRISARGHPTELGYLKWEDAMVEKIQEILAEMKRDSPELFVSEAEHAVNVHGVGGTVGAKAEKTAVERVEKKPIVEENRGYDVAVLTPEEGSPGEAGGDEEGEAHGGNFEGEKAEGADADADADEGGELGDESQNQQGFGDTQQQAGSAMGDYRQQQYQDGATGGGYAQQQQQQGNYRAPPSDGGYQPQQSGGEGQDNGSFQGGAQGGQQNYGNAAGMQGGGSQGGYGAGGNQGGGGQSGYNGGNQNAYQNQAGRQGGGSQGGYQGGGGQSGYNGGNQNAYQDQAGMQGAGSQGGYGAGGNQGGGGSQNAYQNQAGMQGGGSQGGYGAGGYQGGGGGSQNGYQKQAPLSNQMGGTGGRDSQSQGGLQQGGYWQEQARNSIQAPPNGDDEETDGQPGGGDGGGAAPVGDDDSVQAGGGAPPLEGEGREAGPAEDGNGVQAFGDAPPREGEGDGSEAGPAGDDDNVQAGGDAQPEGGNEEQAAGGDDDNTEAVVAPPLGNGNEGGGGGGDDDNAQPEVDNGAQEVGGGEGEDANEMPDGGEDNADGDGDGGNDNGAADEDNANGAGDDEV